MSTLKAEIYQSSNQSCPKGLHNLIWGVIKKQINSVCEQEMEDSILPKLLIWVDQAIIPVTRALFQLDMKMVSIEPKISRSLAERDWFRMMCGEIVPVVFHLFMHTRIKNIFEIIKLLPDSEPALLDLRP